MFNSMRKFNLNFKQLFQYDSFFAYYLFSVYGIVLPTLFLYSHPLYSLVTASGVGLGSYMRINKCSTREFNNTTIMATACMCMYVGTASGYFCRWYPMHTMVMTAVGYGLFTLPITPMPDFRPLTDLEKLPKLSTILENKDEKMENKNEVKNDDDVNETVVPLTSPLLPLSVDIPVDESTNKIKVN